ncbi:unnamed protein product [Zymoseptoria tritici ST99CH_3D7]|uniref:Uncharacterized protein n=1 Tax=Zymoseptoria tritici (strain ST99CH_3D7) TaxID=1276538 RepID=A0A1X7RRX7_ZYMT9|nr:unnamed protein product [Zymoseptoria tritici ST99CH_3D7]
MFLDEISYNDPGLWMRTMKACKNELTHVALRASSLLDVESTIGHAQNIIPQFQSVMLYLRSRTLEFVILSPGRARRLLSD